MTKPNENRKICFMIKAVLIDIDNTLLDFDGYVKFAMKKGFEDFGLIEYKDEMFDTFTAINNQMWQAIEKGEITYEQLLKTRWNKVFKEIGVAFDGCVFEKFFKDTLFYNAILVDGAIDALKYLKEKYILAVASNGPYLQQLNRLKIAGINKYISHNFISEKIGVSKPERKFFEYCLKELNENDQILPSEIMMIGDSLSSDMLGAINFGIKTCFYDRNKTNNTKNLKIDYVMQSLDQIKNIL